MNMSKQIIEVSDEEKKRLGELLLLADIDNTNLKAPLKASLLRTRVIQYIQEHFDEIKQNAEKYGISEGVDLLKNVTVEKVELHLIHVSADKVPGYNDIDIVDILKVRPAFEDVRVDTVKDFCWWVSDNGDNASLCMNDLKHVKWILWLPMKYKFPAGEYTVATMLVYLY